jgi:hypothetical protein
MTIAPATNPSSLKPAIATLAHIGANAMWAPARLTELVDAGHAKNASGFVGSLLRDMSVATQSITAAGAWGPTGLSAGVFDAHTGALEQLQHHLQAAQANRGAAPAAKQAIEGQRSNFQALAGTALKLHDSLVAQL